VRLIQQSDEEVAIADNVRAEEGATAIVTTVVETRDDVRWLKRAVQVLLDHNGLVVSRGGRLRGVGGGTDPISPSGRGVASGAEESLSVSIMTTRARQR